MAKAKYWVGVLYPENMVSDWQDKIDNLVQVPFAYCVHDQDLDNDEDARKEHIHLILAFPNTTTQNHAETVFHLLSKEGSCCFSAIKQIIHIRNMYNYLIHDTDKCKKDGKFQYDPKLRITGNNFDIGAYEQVSIEEKNRMLLECYRMIKEKKFVTFLDFVDYALENAADHYLVFDVIKSNSGFLERCIKSNYHKYYENALKKCVESSN